MAFNLLFPPIWRFNSSLPNQGMTAYQSLFPLIWRLGIDIIHALVLHPISNRVNFSSSPNRQIWGIKGWNIVNPACPDLSGIARSVGIEMKDRGKENFRYLQIHLLNIIILLT